LPQIVEEAKRLRDAGYREIVLAGIQLGAYGQDQEAQPALPDVLLACADIEGIERIRLSSIEPTDVTDALIQIMREIPKICPQLHIPLQSGDDEVLRAMNRRYDRDYYRDLITRLRTALPDFALTLDVMAGFVGETHPQFENTVALLQEVNPLKCHVFPYSPREGTRAARFEGELPPEVVRERVQQLMALGEDLGRRYREPYIGRTLPVLVEGKQGPGGLVQGHTANFLKVCFQGNELMRHKIVPVQLLAQQGPLFLGKPINERAPR
jgi:threonylcarbamoyladenosine tRNA methylthiotransferase MtaB